MNGVSNIAQLIGRLITYQSFSHPYRGSLNTSACKAERGLFALLLAGFGLIVLIISLHMKALFPVELDSVKPSPPRIEMHIATEHSKPEIALKANNNDSLFQVVKPDTSAPPLLAKPEEREVRPKTPIHKMRLWQLHIQRSPISETTAFNEVANAARQLQSGNVSLAKRTLQAMLIQDPHSVEAMEGMRLVSRQLDDAESEQKYLEMLQLEIPDYGLDHDDALISGLD